MLTDYQQRLRQGRITSSLIYWVVNAPHKAWRILAGLDEESKEGFEEAIEIGNALEKPIMGIVGKRLGLQVRKAPFRVHPQYEWMADSCDAVLYEKAEENDDYAWMRRIKAIAEIKTAGTWVASQYGEEGTDDVPPKVLYQCHWHLLHWPEVDVCHAAALLSGGMLSVKIFPVERDREFQEALVDIATEFHRKHMLEGVEPAPDWHASTTEYFKRKFPSGNGQLIQAEPSLVSLLLELQEHKRMAKELDQSKVAMENALRQFIGENYGAEYDGKKVAWFADIAESSYMPTEPITKKAYRRLYISDKHLKGIAP
jgi:predicted phage-related endonuclease